MSAVESTLGHYCRSTTTLEGVTIPPLRTPTSTRSTRSMMKGQFPHVVRVMCGYAIFPLHRTWATGVRGSDPDSLGSVGPDAGGCLRLAAGSVELQALAVPTVASMSVAKISEDGFISTLLRRERCAARFLAGSAAWSGERTGPARGYSVKSCTPHRSTAPKMKPSCGRLWHMRALAGW